MNPIFAKLLPDSIPIALDLRRKLYEHEDLGYEPGDAESLLHELIERPEFGALWLIQADGQAAGYLLLTICYSLEFGGRFGLLDEFYIDDGWRGRGIGGAALDFVQAECRSRGLRAVRLEVAHANPRALELYRRTGFAVDARHLMTKWL